MRYTFVKEGIKFTETFDLMAVHGERSAVTLYMTPSILKYVTNTLAAWWANIAAALLPHGEIGTSKKTWNKTSQKGGWVKQNRYSKESMAGARCNWL